MGNSPIAPKYLQLIMGFKDYILTPIIFMALIYFSFNPLELKYLTVHPGTWRWNIIITLILASILLKIWAYRTLGDSWSDKLRVDEELNLVTTGPYRFFRHSVYMSYVLFLITVILSGNVFLPLLFLAFVFCNSVREKQEEKFLKRQFPEYEQKMGLKITSTGAIVIIVIIVTTLTGFNDILRSFKHFF